MLKVTLTGAQAFRLWAARTFDRKRFDADLVRLGEQMGERVKGTAKDKYLRGRPGLKRVTGRLADSIRYRLYPNSSGYSLQFGTDVIYARIHELGGIILPKNAKYLRFVIGGRTFFRQKVTIPARPFLKPAVLDNLDDFRARVENYFRTASA